MLRRYVNQVPFHSRPAFFYESLYNVGRGVFLELFPFCAVILKTVLDGQLWQLTVLACIWGGSGLLAPYVAFLGRRIEMRSLVIWPNVLAGLCFLAIALVPDATGFMVLVSIAYLVGLLARVAEMSLYRVFYPPTHRSLAVGWLKSITFVVGGVAVLLATWMLNTHARWYWMLFVVSGTMLLGAVWAYRQIPIPASSSFVARDHSPGHRVLARALATLWGDRRFLLYQGNFFASGFANHMSTILVAEVLREDLGADVLFMAVAYAVIPVVMRAVSAPLWGPFLDRVTPMAGRAIFNLFLMAAYSLYCYGGVTRTAWAFLIAAVLHGVGQGGNQINWTTGSLYFAGKEQVPLYNSVHVALTGIRGLVAPLVGAWLYSARGLGLGPWVFAFSVLLGGVGFVGMIYQDSLEKGRLEPPARATDSRDERGDPIESLGR
jgi:MFS family permease